MSWIRDAHRPGDGLGVHLGAEGDGARPRAVHPAARLTPAPGPSPDKGDRGD